MTLRLTLLCHASTAAMRAFAFPGDEPIDAQARRKLAAMSLPLGPLHRCITSPALRARQTAEALKLDATDEPSLRDCDYGRWTGRTLADVQTADPQGVAAWLADPGAAPHGGETLLDLMARVALWLDGQRDASGRIVAVTHATVVRAAIVHAIHAAPRSFWHIDIAPLSVTTLGFGQNRWTLASVVTAKEIADVTPTGPRPGDAAPV